MGPSRVDHPRRRIPGITASCLMLAAITIGAATRASATPRYAARYEQRCSLCHHDPSGGGKRSLYATQYLLPTEMAARGLSIEEITGEGPMIGEKLSIGFDLRTLHTYSEREEDLDNFFQMQGDVYLAFHLNDRFSAYVDQSGSGTTEAYGLGYVLPASGYLKVGRFAPPYGWRVGDHTLFVRDRQGLAPPGHTDVGLECGLFPGGFTLQAAVVNGSLGSTRDRDRNLAGVGRVGYRLTAAGLGLALGGSVLYNPYDGDAMTLAGPFWSLSGGPVVWLGEVGWQIQESSGLQSAQAADAAEVTQFTTSHQLALQLQQGWDVLATYDFTDPDLDLKDGAITRYGLGTEVLLYPFLHLRLAGHLTEEDRPAPQTDETYLATELQVHFLY